MPALPNPFESALDPATGADDGHWPATADPADPVAVTSLQKMQNAESSTAREDIREAPAVEQLELPQAAGATDDTNYIPELFSVFARRRCMHIISPPLPQQCRREFEPDMDALFDAIVPPEPPPLFLRKPSEAFMRALFELTH